MKAIYGGPCGDMIKESRIKAYGWLNGSINASTSHQSNTPSSYWIDPNNAMLNQAVFRLEREVDTVQTDHVDYGFRMTYDYGTDYFKAYLKPIGCKCVACEKKRKKKRAEARAERLRLKAKELKKAERKAKKEAAKRAAKRAKAKKAKDKAKDKVKERAKEKAKEKAKGALRPDRKRKLDSKSKTPTVRLKTGSRPGKRKAAGGARAGVGSSVRRSRPKSRTIPAIRRRPTTSENSGLMN